MVVIVVLDSNQNFQILSLFEEMSMCKRELPFKWISAGLNINLNISNLNQQLCNNVAILDPTGSWVEIVKCGFWRKLPLLPLLWHANAVDKIALGL